VVRQTTYWRLESPDVAWVSVGLPEMVEVQERLLPTEPAITRITSSALDQAWLDAVPPGPAVVFAGAVRVPDPRSARRPDPQVAARSDQGRGPRHPHPVRTERFAPAEGAQ
jgi:hypothetical protein